MLSTKTFTETPEGFWQLPNLTDRSAWKNTRRRCGSAVCAHALKNPRWLQRLEQPVADLGADFGPARQDKDALSGQGCLDGDGNDGGRNRGEGGVIGQEPDQRDGRQAVMGVGVLRKERIPSGA